MFAIAHGQGGLHRIVSQCIGGVLRYRLGNLALRGHLPAQRADDRFGELFHRGAGLLALVKEQEASKDRDETFREEMLCKALRSLNEAKELNPTDTRARLRLAEVYDRTHNRRAADAERAAGDVLRLPHEPR